MRTALPAKALLSFALLHTSAFAQAQAPERLFDRAVAEQSRGDYPSAIRDYRQFLAASPRSAEARANLGAALAHTGEFDQAIEQYQAALRALPSGSPVAADIHLNLALAYYKKGDMKRAQAALEPLHRAQLQDARIATLLGDADTHLGDAAGALAVMTPIAAANQDNPDFNLVYGSALIAHGERRQGAALVERVAAAKQSAEAYMLAGSALLALNEFEGAHRDLDAAEALNPKLPGLATLVGTAKDDVGDPKGAIPAFEAALHENPDDFNANLTLGAILVKQRDLAGAKGYLDRALAINPASSMAHYEHAMLANTAGEYAAAASELEKVTVADPDWLEPHVALATLYYRLHKPELGAKERARVDALTATQQAKGPGKR